MRTLPAVLLDVACVVLFVAAGLVSHGSGAGVSAVAATGWPFLAGLLLGWLVTRAWRAPAAVVRTGAGVWIATAGGGVALRLLSGETAALAFVVTTVLLLGAALLGWRAAVSLFPAPRR